MRTDSNLIGAAYLHLAHASVSKLIEVDTGLCHIEWNTYLEDQKIRDPV